MNNSPESALLSELQNAGIPLNEQPRFDDKLHRYKAPGDSDANSWYVMHVLPANNGHDPLIVGFYGCWRRDIKVKWTSRNRSNMSREEWSAASAKWQDMEKKRQAEEVAAQQKARQKCQSWFASFPRFTQDDLNFYLLNKGITPDRAGPVYISTDENTKGWLALPLQDIDGIIHSAQFISDDGDKKFCYQGRIKGCFFLLSESPLESRGGPIIVCEGYATGNSVANATGWPVVCAMNCGNLSAVTKDLRSKFPGRTIIIAADNDAYTENNPGVTKAREAAKAYNARVAIPEFADSVTMERPTDFNDLAQASGLDEVRRQIIASMPMAAVPIGQLQLPTENDPTELIKYRFLCERGCVLMTGPTGKGKSSWLVQMGAAFANNLPHFGMIPAKPMRTLIIQAENDDGDMAQMRDGIARGLNLDEDQRQIFFNNVYAFNSVGVSGSKFCSEVLRPLIELHQPHICAIDPAFAYVGGNVKEQEVVTEFLRNNLNPIIFEYRCGLFLSHHVNKPMLARGIDRSMEDLAYAGSGSAEFANWARGGLSIQSTPDQGIFKLHATKRGARLAWSEGEGDERKLVYERYIAWSKDGTICWRTPDPSEISDSESSSGTRGGSAPKYTVNDIIDVFASTGATSLSVAEWKKAANDERGISRATFFRLLERATKDGRAIKSVAAGGRYQLVTPSESDSPAQGK